MGSHDSWYSEAGGSIGQRGQLLEQAKTIYTLAMYHQLSSCKADSMLNARLTAGCPAVLQNVACAVPLGHSNQLASCCCAGQQPPTSLRSRVMSGRLCTIMVALCQPEGSYQRRSKILSSMFLKVIMVNLCLCHLHHYYQVPILLGILLECSLESATSAECPNLR